MARGDKSAYTDKQKRKAEHIEEGYEKRGVPEDEAERRAWATVNKESGGGKKSGSGRGKPETHVSSRRGGKIGGKAAAGGGTFRLGTQGGRDAQAQGKRLSAVGTREPPRTSVTAKQLPSYAGDRLPVTVGSDGGGGAESSATCSTALKSVHRAG